MRTKMLCAVDLFLIGLSIILALMARDEYVLQPARLTAAAPYFLTSMVLGILVLSMTGVNQRLWRFVGLEDLGQIITVSVAVGFGSYAITALLNGAEGLPRSIPLLHSCFILLTMTGVRVVARLRYRFRDRLAPLTRQALTPTVGETVLLVGYGRIAELYVRSLAEIQLEALRGVRIAGLLGPDTTHVGRLMLGYPVLGSVEAIESVLEDLRVHGVRVDRVIVTTATDKLSSMALEALHRVETVANVRVTRLDALVSGAPERPPQVKSELTDRNDDTVAPPFSIAPKDIIVIGQRSFWRLKRGIDVCGAILLLVLTLPVVAIVSLLVLFDIGTPIIFWQQRPGLGGRPFKLYKFRSMRKARDDTGRVLTETERGTGVGKFLRRTRLDELPQLFNILVGDMSFIGPRPLLQEEQPASCAARLLVRPGLTGFAQVMGGRDIPITDKTALDVWYFRNASLWLDLTVALKTVPVILLGERVSLDQISAVWRDLERAGVSRARTTDRSVHNTAVGAK